MAPLRFEAGSSSAAGMGKEGRLRNVTHKYLHFPMQVWKCGGETEEKSAAASEPRLDPTAEADPGSAAARRRMRRTGRKEGHHGTTLHCFC